jgi:hypothetical protein
MSAEPQVVMIGTNPSITCMMIGEKYADLIDGATDAPLAYAGLVR